VNACIYERTSYRSKQFHQQLLTCHVLRFITLHRAYRKADFLWPIARIERKALTSSLSIHFHSNCSRGRLFASPSLSLYLTIHFLGVTNESRRTAHRYLMQRHGAFIRRIIYTYAEAGVSASHSMIVVSESFVEPEQFV